MAENVRIRIANIEDADAIAEILLRAFAEFRSEYTAGAFDDVTPTSEVVARRFDEGPIWIAVKDGRIVGTVSATAEPGWLYIRSLAVLPEARGLSIGRRLLEEVERYSVQNGFEKLFLYTTHAQGLYEKNGFNVVRETTAEEWHGVPGLAMEKLIGRKLKNAIGS